MAEFVQLRLEEWAPILAQIQRLDLMRPDEIRGLTSNLQEKEYAIQKLTRTLEDVLNYVDYQVQLVDILSRRRMDTQHVEKWKEIEEKILFRINSLFGVYERLFCKDLKYWEARLIFNMKQKWFDGTFKVYQSAIIHLGSAHTYLYEKASSFEWSRNPLKNIESARRILEEGLRLNPGNLDLYIWRYDLELKHAEYLMTKADKIKSVNTLKQTDHEPQAMKCLQAAEITYKTAVNSFLTIQNNSAVQLYTRFLEALLKYPRFEDQMKPILRDMELNCKTEEESYGAVAQLYSKKGQFQIGLSELEKGLILLPTMKMYDIAVRVLDNLIKEEQQPMKAVYALKLNNILLRGLDKNLLSEDSFVIWLELFSSHCHAPSMKEHKSKGDASNGIGTVAKDNDVFNAASRIKVVITAAERYPSNMTFAIEILKNQMDAKLPPAVINKTIAKIQKHASKDSTDDVLFNIVLIYMECGSRKKLSWLDSFFHSSPERAAKYIHYINLNDGIVEARKAYQQSCQRDSYIVLKTMADMEFKCLNHSATNWDKFKAVREIMEKACILHGKDNLEVWIDFITYEKAVRNENLASEIYARALNSVNTTLKEKLMHRYLLLGKMN